MSEGVMPKRWEALRSRYSMPRTESNLPTKIEVRWERVGIHSSWARSTSRKSPRLKFEPDRGTKFTLAVATALSPRPEVKFRFSSLEMKPGAQNKYIIVIDADLAKSTFSWTFAK